MTRVTFMIVGMIFLCAKWKAFIEKNFLETINSKKSGKVTATENCFGQAAEFEQMICLYLTFQATF